MPVNITLKKKFHFTPSQNKAEEMAQNLLFLFFSTLDHYLEKSFEFWYSRYLLCGFYGGCCRHNHEYAVNENGSDNEERKQLMYKDIDGNSTDWIEWVEQPHCIACAKSEYVLPFTDHYKRLKQTEQLLSLAIQT